MVSLRMRDGQRQHGARAGPVRASSSRGTQGRAGGQAHRERSRADGDEGSRDGARGGEIERERRHLDDPRQRHVRREARREILQHLRVVMAHARDAIGHPFGGAPEASPQRLGRAEQAGGPGAAAVRRHRDAADVRRHG